MPKKATGRTPRKTVNVPQTLYTAIEDLVERQHRVEGYVSVDDFIRDTLRRRLEELTRESKRHGASQP